MSWAEYLKIKQDMDKIREDVLALSPQIRASNDESHIFFSKSTKVTNSIQVKLAYSGSIKLRLKAGAGLFSSQVTAVISRESSFIELATPTIRWVEGEGDEFEIYIENIARNEGINVGFFPNVEAQDNQVIVDCFGEVYYNPIINN